ncbi:DISARM system phospholipase D-like protein DrmC [Thiocapsa marina]|uniref:Phospholipase D/Transphosphatidylase n=1 Tax=Thiocapsa marina 5811 TaxID=768671 RepID=F9UHU7_9GAMM|nr:DISARM system phospholipase D-like protein DrmC [Thiocapsa marina]EGV16273.1 phospholipase D/Transphosphatidylase [Thiocapsa marina 5811]
MAMSDDFCTAVENLVRKAPDGWLTATCETLRALPASATLDLVRQRLPGTHNADLAYRMDRVLDLASTQMSWEALSWSLRTTFTAYRRWRGEEEIELLWSGPTPANQIPARRIDQALYDLIGDAKRDILLVTFAAAKINRLADALLKAVSRGVQVKLILEFERSSEGQLSFDALKAFPTALVAATRVYHWPLDKRERNQAGRPGKLHAKVAIVDDMALISSANLTDDAFNRNLEIGVMIGSDRLRGPLTEHILALVRSGQLVELR